MTDSSEPETTGSTDSGIRTAPGESEAVEAVGTYESGETVVFYDTENPLAWVQSRVTVALAEMA
jgi:hypothetical protein